MKAVFYAALLAWLAGQGSAQINIRDYGGSGSVAQGHGSVLAAQMLLDLDDPADFQEGQGIEIDHFGAPCVIAGKPCTAPAAPAVSVQGGPPGVVHYGYALIDVTPGGGMSAASPPAFVTNGPAQLDGLNLNHLAWAPTKGSAGKIVCRQIGALPFEPIALVADSGTFDDTNFQDAGDFYFANEAPAFFPTAGFPYVPIWGLGACQPGRAAAPDNLVTTITSIKGNGKAFLADAPGVSGSAVINHSEDAALEAAEKAATAMPGQTSTVYFSPGSYNFFTPTHLLTSATSDQNFDVTLISYAVGDGFVFQGLDQFTNLFVAKPSFINANMGIAPGQGSMRISRIYEMGGAVGLDDHGIPFSGVIENSFFLANQNGLSINPYNVVLTDDEFYAVPDGTAPGSPWIFTNGVLCNGSSGASQWVNASNLDIEYLTHGGVGINGCGKGGALVATMSGDLSSLDFDSSGVNVLVGGRTVILAGPVTKERQPFSNPGGFPVSVLP